jgi:hypothetical protein
VLAIYGYGDDADELIGRTCEALLKQQRTPDSRRGSNTDRLARNKLEQPKC